MSFNHMSRLRREMVLERCSGGVRMLFESPPSGTKGIIAALANQPACSSHSAYYLGWVIPCPAAWSLLIISRHILQLTADMWLVDSVHLSALSLHYSACSLVPNFFDTAWPVWRTQNTLRCISLSSSNAGQSCPLLTGCFPDPSAELQLACCTQWEFTLHKEIRPTMQ